VKTSTYVIILIALLPSALFGQASTEELSLLLADGTIQLISINGNGSSSGASLEGVIRNSSSRTVQANVNLMPPLYFQNKGGSGQNMVATQVYLEDGGYFSNAGETYIEIGPNSSVSLLIIAYCADFEKDNPSSTDSFSVTAIPQSLVDVSWKVSNYEATNPDADIMVAAQVAIWLSQGETAEDIQSKFSYSASDERLARELLR
jgi:hypothetical protein